MKRSLILGLTVFMAASIPALAYLCPGTVSVLGAGQSLGLVAIGNYAVIGAGPDLVVFDMVDPVHPVRLGSAAFGETVIPVGTYEGRILALVNESQSYRLAVFGLDPEGMPEGISSVLLPGGLRPDDLVVVGDMAWIVTSSPDDGLLGIDLNDPEDPELITRFALQLRSGSIAAVDDQLLMTTMDGLLIADVSDPSNPAIVGSLAIDDAQTVVAFSDHAYVGSLDAIHTIDISDLSAPVEVWTVDIDHSAVPTDIVVVDHRLIVGLSDYDPQISIPDGGLLTFDIASPGNPVTLADIHFPSEIRSLAISQGAIVAADALRGLRVFDPDPSSGHAEIARANITLDSMIAVAVREDHAYVADQGLRVVEISDHRDPVLVSSVEFEFGLIDVAVNETGDRIAVLSGGAELHVFSASDPENPVLESSTVLDGRRLALSGNLLTVVSRDLGFSVLDVSDPEQPIVRSHVQTSGYAVSVAMSGDIAVIGMKIDGDLGSMVVYDLGDPTDPVLLSQTPTQSGVFGVDIDGSRAAIATWYTVVYFDLSDPTAPIELGSYEIDGGSADGIALDGDRVHISTWPGGLQILDFSTSVAPRQVVEYWWNPIPIVDGGPLGGYDIAVHEGASIIADGQFGLRTFEVKKCLPKTDPNLAPPVVD